MISSLTVHLYPVEDSILPSTMGHYVHAAFLDALRHADRETAEQLHRAQPYKPFTVSPLQGKFTRYEKGKVLVAAGTECWLRFTIMDDHLLSVLMHFLLEKGMTSISLGKEVFSVTRIDSSNNGKDGKWSGNTTFEELSDCAQLFDKANIRFYSPTAFRIRSRSVKESQSYVFPDPVYCFQSWLRRWNAFSPAPLDENPLLRLVHEHIRFSRYSIKTNIMDFGGYRQLGFVGQCEYQYVKGTGGGANGNTRALLTQLSALTDFAFYSGTGYKTTMGMGQTRREK